MTPPAPAPYAIGVDTGATTLREADHLLRALAAELDLPEDVFGCTHLVRDGRPRVALSLAAEDEPVLRAARDRLTGQGYEVGDGAPDEAGRAVSSRAPAPSPARSPSPRCWRAPRSTG